MAIFARPAKYNPYKAANTFNLAKFTVGSKSSNTINVAVQLQDAKGNNVAQLAKVKAWISDNSDGSTLTATVPTSTLAIGTNGTIFNQIVSNKYVDILTNSSGKFDLNIIQTATPVAYYLAIELPDGSVIASPIIQF